MRTRARRISLLCTAGGFPADRHCTSRCSGVSARVQSLEKRAEEVLAAAAVAAEMAAMYTGVAIAAAVAGAVVAVAATAAGRTQPVLAAGLANPASGEAGVARGGAR